MLKQAFFSGKRSLEFTLSKKTSYLRRIGAGNGIKVIALSTKTQEPPSWTMKMLYDGDCPLCLREVNMLVERNKTYQAIKFVDISSKEYCPEENAGIDYEKAMGRIHVISNDGKVFTNVEAFKQLYEAVGLGWVYAITNYEPFKMAADVVYDVWAKYRLPLTGRPPLAQVLENRRQNSNVECDTDTCKRQGEE